MAVVVSNGANKLTDANNVLTAISYNSGWFSNTVLALSSTRTITLTTDATPHGIAGIILGLNTAAHCDRSVQIVVKKAGATQGTFTFTASQIHNGVANATSDCWFTKFTWAAITGVDNTAAWTLEISQTGGTTGTWNLKTSNATAISHCEITDKVANLASNDTLYDIDGMTSDANFTLRGVLGTGESAYAPALIVCNTGTAPIVGNTVGFKHSAGTLTIDGGVLLGAHSGFRNDTLITFTGALSAGDTSATLTGNWAGTTGTYSVLFSSTEQRQVTLTNGSTAVTWTGGLDSAETTSANVGSVSAWLSFSSTPTNGTKVGFWDSQILAAAADSRKMSLILIGLVPATERTTLAQSALNNANSLTAGDASFLSSGDRIIVGKITTKGASDTNSYVVGAVSGNTVPITPNLSGARSAHTAAQPNYIARVSGYGYKITGSATTLATSRLTYPSNFVLSGVELGFLSFQLARTINSEILDDTANKSKYLLEHCGAYGIPAGGVIAGVGMPTAGFDILYNNVNGKLITSNGKGTTGVMTVKNNFVCIADSSAGYNLLANDIEEDNAYCNGTRADVTVTSPKTTRRNNHYWGNGGVISQVGGAVVLSGCIDTLSWSGNYYDNNAVAMTIEGGNTGIESLDDFIGSETANTTDMDFRTSSYIHARFTNPSAFALSAAALATLQSSVVNGSMIVLKNYAGTDGDNITYEPYVNFTTDSPYVNLVQTQTNTTLWSEHVFELLTETVANKEFTFTCDVNIAATYDDGTYTWPKVDIYVDDNPVSGTADFSVSAAATGDSSLSLKFTPTADGKKVRIVFRAKTATASAPVKWSNAHVYTVIWGYDIVDLSLGISETLTYPIGTILTPVVNPFITLTEVQAAALSTSFSYDGTTYAMTADATMIEKYEYGQYLKIQDPTITIPTDTIDGINLTDYKDFDDGGFDLMGGYSVTMDTGKTYTQTGTYDGIIIHADGTRTLHVKLNTLVAGSTVQIYNTDDSSEIYKDVVAGTSLDYIYTYSADKNIRVRVRQAGYIPYQATGTITSTGFSLNVSQEADAVYTTNAIDGSTVTEFSMSEGVIKVYVDDPDNITTFQRLYNWYQYSLATTTYIDDQTNLITANSTREYIFDDSLSIKNLDGANPLYIYGANVKNTSGDNAVIDATGGSIFIRGDYPAASVTEIRQEMDANSVKLDDAATGALMR